MIGSGMLMYADTQRIAANIAIMTSALVFSPSLRVFRPRSAELPSDRKSVV